MRHFVQYHNPDKFGPYRCSKRGAQIVTDKSVENLIGDTVWLVSRRNRPARYVLSDVFVVEKTGSNEARSLKNFAFDAQGCWFERPVDIGEEPWFEKLRRVTGNFAFGLQPVRDESVVRGLEIIATVEEIRRASPPKSIKPGK
jgi:hypothetical protein